MNEMFHLLGRSKLYMCVFFTTGKAAKILISSPWIEKKKRQKEEIKDYIG